MKNNELEKDLLEELERDPITKLIGDCLRNKRAENLVLNIQRYSELLHAKKALDYTLGKSFEDEKAEISFLPLFSCGTLTAEVDTFEVTDMAAFAEVLIYADNFEVYPLTNGRIRLGFVFKGMMREV